MAKKGAFSAGTGKGRARAKDQERAKQLPPAPVTWNPRADLWPYHSNMRSGNVSGRRKV